MDRREEMLELIGGVLAAAPPESLFVVECDVRFAIEPTARPGGVGRAILPAGGGGDLREGGGREGGTGKAKGQVYAAAFSSFILPSRFRPPPSAFSPILPIFGILILFVASGKHPLFSQPWAADLVGCVVLLPLLGWGERWSASAWI